MIEQACTFFMLAASPSAAFPERCGDGVLKLHIEVGEIIVAALPQGDSTRVRGSASRGAHLLTRFLATIGQPLEVNERVKRYRYRKTVGALTTSAVVQYRASAAPGSGAPDHAAASRAA